MRVKDARQTFVGIWIRLALEGKPFEVWGGEQLRDFTYVDDVVKAFLLAAFRPEAEGRVFNLGGIGQVSLNHLAEVLVAAAGQGEFTLRDFPADRKKIDIGDCYADGRLIETTLGWKPRTDLLKALRHTVAYYRRELPHYL
jgi:UDP-glucose 4-epimerase